jgi:hypothetical protein
MIFNMSMYSVFYIVYALVENKAFDLIWFDISVGFPLLKSPVLTQLMLSIAVQYNFWQILMMSHDNRQLTVHLYAMRVQKARGNTRQG